MESAGPERAGRCPSSGLKLEVLLKYFGWLEVDMLSSGACHRMTLSAVHFWLDIQTVASLHMSLQGMLTNCQSCLGKSLSSVEM